MSRPRDRRPALDAQARVALYGRRACSLDEAGFVRAAAETDREVLPRYHQDDRGWQNRHRGVHYFAAPGKYAQIRSWHGREHWLSFIVPTTIAMHRAELRRAGVSPGTFLLWARAESLYAQDRRTGRRCIARPDTVAQVAGLGKSTAQRCRALAERLGLRVVVFRGRMLNVHECWKARRRGSCQRGLSTEAALTIPSTVTTETPTSGTSLRPKKLPFRALPSSAASGARTEPAPPARPRRRSRRDRRPAHLARAIQQRVPWLRREPLSALIGPLHRFATNDPSWTANDLIEAIDAENYRRGWTSISSEHIRTRPAAVLAWYLRQVDQHADHPRLEAFAAGTATEQRRAWCGQCDQTTRLVDIPPAAAGDHPTVARCPRCHPLSPEPAW